MLYVSFFLTIYQVIWDVIDFFARFFRVETGTPQAVLSRATELMSYSGMVKAGRFEFIPDVTSVTEYLDKLRETEQLLRNVLSLPYNHYTAPISVKLDRCLGMIRDLEMQQTDCTLRRQPFGIVLTGLPGTGKSGTAIKLAVRLMKEIGVELKPHEMVVLNEGDQFQSEFRTNHRVVIFDDLGATRTDKIPNDPFRKVIDFVNNIRRAALNPNLELKGNVYIEPDIVITTTNLDWPLRKQAQAVCNSESVMCHDAINRRFPLAVEVLNYDSFKEVLVKSDQAMANSNPVLNTDQLFSLASKMFKSHYGEQTTFIQRINSIFDAEPALKAEGLVLDSQSGTETASYALTALRKLVSRYIGFRLYNLDDELIMWAPIQVGWGFVAAVLDRYIGRLTSAAISRRLRQPTSYNPFDLITGRQRICRRLVDMHLIFSTAMDEDLERRRVRLTSLGVSIVAKYLLKLSSVNSIMFDLSLAGISALFRMGVKRPIYRAEGRKKNEKAKTKPIEGSVGIYAVESSTIDKVHPIGSVKERIAATKELQTLRCARTPEQKMTKWFQSNGAVKSTFTRNDASSTSYMILEDVNLSRRFAVSGVYTFVYSIENNCLFVISSKKRGYVPLDDKYNWLSTFYEKCGTVVMSVGLGPKATLSITHGQWREQYHLCFYDSLRIGILKNKVFRPHYRKLDEVEYSIDPTLPHESSSDDEKSIHSVDSEGWPRTFI